MAQYYKDNKHVDWTPVADTAVGILVEAAGGVGIVDPTNDGAPAPAGKLHSITMRGTAMVPNPDGIAVADGGTIGYDATNDKATAAAGGDFDLTSKVIGTYNGSESHIQVMLG